MSAGQEFVPQNSPKRVWGTPFPKGKSGNPAGRPKSTLLMALAKFGEQKREGKTNAAWLAETAWKKAIGGDIEWAEWLADRLLGKPAQVMYASQDPALPAIWPFLAKSGAAQEPHQNGAGVVPPGDPGVRPVGGSA